MSRLLKKGFYLLNVSTYQLGAGPFEKVEEAEKECATVVSTSPDKFVIVWNPTEDAPWGD